MTRFGVTALALSSIIATSCIRITTVVEQQGSASSSAARSVIFEAPVPVIPEELHVYNLEPVMPKGEEVRALLKQRCWETCTRAAPGSPNKSKLCADVVNEPSPKPAPAAPVAAFNRGPQAQRPVQAQEFDYCQIGEDLSVQIYPKLNQLAQTFSNQKGQEPADHLFRARKFLEDMTRSPEDGMTKEVTFGEGRLLTRTTMRASDKGDLATQDHGMLLLFASAQRRVADRFNVDGPGSRLGVMVDGQDAVQGMMHSWKKSLPGEQMKPMHDAASLREEIARQLRAFGGQTSAYVKRIELIYYDGNKQILQPAFRYVAEFSTNRHSVGHPEQVVGYVAYARTSEPIPQLGAAAAPDLLATTLAGVALAPNAAQVGVFVVREDKQGWRDNAIAFKAGFAQSLRAGIMAPIDIHDATREQFTSAYQQFVNKVDLAMVEAHGIPGGFATLHSNRDFVRLGNTEAGFPSAGYGPSSNGRLRHLAIHSCDVLRRPEDVRWDTVFKGGLQTVVGYRTPMYITDGVNELFAKYVSEGAPVVAAWFGAVNSLNVYQLDSTTKLRCGGDEEAMGRPAAITACGAEDATLFEASNASADCLQVWKTLDALEG